MGAGVERVALTGGIATGKSHVRAEFEKLGVPTIDADVLARQAVAPHTPGLAAVVARFGREILDASGGLDRQRLAAVVFADAGARRDLEQIVHPFVQRAIDRWFDALGRGGHAVAIADIPLLYETGRDRDFESVIVTACDPATQLARVMDRGATEEDARRRIAAKLPIEDKVRRADYVIRTDGTIEETNDQVRRVYRALRRADAGGTR
jgi:dephospho-CoA kinase